MKRKKMNAGNAKQISMEPIPVSNAESNAEEHLPKVLIVDENRGTRLLVKALLTIESVADCFVAENAERAYHILEEEYDMDIVIAEIHLKGTSGMDLLTHIKNTKPEISVIMITANPNEMLVLRSLKKGASDFLQKPFDKDTFLMSVRAEIGLRGHERKSLIRTEIESDIKNWVEITSSSEYGQVERLRRFVAVLYETDLSEEEKNRVRFVIDELCRNAVEWGNSADETLLIKLSYCLFDDKIVFKIEDQGTGFNLENLPDPTENPIEFQKQRKLHGKRVGGYGIYLSRKIMDEILYNEKGNIVIMKKNLT